MTRLPVPGSDNGTWGDILNEFLTQAHNTDGTLKDDSVGSRQIQAGAISKQDVGLGNVDNTSDTSKPVSTAQQTALNSKQNISSLDSDVAAFIPSSTGSAIASAITSRQPHINVKDYGAVGNGVTNDTAAINAALSALSAGGVLVFPPGRYMTDGNHSISQPSVTIIGPSGRAQTYNSQAQLYLRSNANTDMFTIANNQVTIRNLSLYGNYSNQSATSRGVVLSTITSANYFLLDTVWVDSFNGDGIVLQSASTTLSGTITKSESRLNRGYGLNVTGTASDIIISDCYIDQNTQSGIMCTASDLSLTSCHLWGNGTSASGNIDGITFQSSAGCRVENCYIESNTNGAGIRYKSGTMKGHIVTGCDIWGNGTQGIYAFGLTNSIISNNIIRNNNYKNQANAGGAGIVVDTCTAIVISNNNMYQENANRQTYGYYENGTSNANCMFIGNISRASQHTTGSWVIAVGTAAPTIPSTPSSYNVG